MTTIAYRDGIMAGDSRAYSGDKHPIGTKQKVFRLPDGTLVGASSSTVGAPNAFMMWLKTLDLDNLAEAMADEVFSVQALVVRPDGSAYYLNDGPCFTGPIKAEFYAIGSGEQSAQAAMMMGADAEQAVEIACEVDLWTGGPVITVAHQKARIRVLAK